MNVHTHSPLHTEGFAHPRSNLETLQIEPGMLIADFGAGSGHYAVEIARMLGTSGRLYAVEVQKDLLRRIHTEATKHGLEDRIEFIWGDLEAPKGSKIADRHLDLVLVSNLLFQVPDKAAIFKEAKRVLKPSGRLAIIDWSDSYSSMGPQRHDVVKREASLALARENGFELVREFAAGAHHYGLIVGQVSKRVHAEPRPLPPPPEKKIEQPNLKKDPDVPTEIAAPPRHVAIRAEQASKSPRPIEAQPDRRAEGEADERVEHAVEAVHHPSRQISISVEHITAPHRQIEVKVEKV